MRQLNIGVLAVQGAFIEHRYMLEGLGAHTFELRQRSDLSLPMDGLVLPGGESTVMGKLLRDLQMLEPIRDKIRQGLPVLGTCAGLILLAERISGDPAVHLATMDICARRNAYGRQLGSFQTTAVFDGEKIPMRFIRAPYIESAGPKAEVLSVVEGRIVAARQGNQLVTAFHPELTQDTAVHSCFLGLAENF